MIKKLTLAGLTIAIATLAPAITIKAQEVKANPQVAAREVPSVLRRQTTPFALVNLAYRGYFTEIPGYTRLAQAYRSGQINANRVVAAGIQQGWIAPETLNDRRYLHAVRLQLRAISNDR